MYSVCGMYRTVCIVLILCMWCIQCNVYATCTMYACGVYSILYTQGVYLQYCRDTAVVIKCDCLLYNPLNRTTTFLKIQTFMGSLKIDVCLS